MTDISPIKIPVYIVASDDKPSLVDNFFSDPLFDVQRITTDLKDEWIKKIISIASMRIENGPIIIVGTDKLTTTKSPQEIATTVKTALDNQDLWDTLYLSVAADDCKLYQNSCKSLLEGFDVCSTKGSPLVLLMSGKIVNQLSTCFRNDTTPNPVRVKTLNPNLFDFDLKRAQADETYLANRCTEVIPVKSATPRDVSTLSVGKRSMTNNAVFGRILLLVAIGVAAYLLVKQGKITIGWGLLIFVIALIILISF